MLRIYLRRYQDQCHLPWTLQINQSNPHTNGFDCGIFVLLFALCDITGLAFASHVDSNLRREIFSCFIDKFIEWLIQAPAGFGAKDNQAEAGGRRLQKDDTSHTTTSPPIFNIINRDEGTIQEDVQRSRSLHSAAQEKFRSTASHSTSYPPLRAPSLHSFPASPTASWLS